MAAVLATGYHLMSDHSTIEWTDATWNPVRGCTKISPGCAHCYAETFAERFRGVPGHPYEQGFDLRLVPEKLAEPLRWSAPKMVFVNSMSDLFHEDVPDDYILAVVRVMRLANWHTYQVLTKRSERMRDLLRTKLRDAADEPHIWWGVSVENRRHGLPRIEHLRAAPARMRFSVGRAAAGRPRPARPRRHRLGRSSAARAGTGPGRWTRVGSARSGTSAGTAGVPFFFKQWGGVRKRPARARAGRRDPRRDAGGIGTGDALA